jgi:integrase/recombinase XerC
MIPTTHSAVVLTMPITREMTLIDDFGRDQRRQGLLDSTIATRGVQLRCFAAAMAPRSLLDATTPDVQLFLDGRRLGAAKSRYGWLSNLGAFYRWAMLEDLIEEDPTARIRRPKLRPGLPRPISDADLELAIGHAGERMSAWLHLGAYAGLRCGEIAGLTRESLLDSYGLLHIVGKGRKERLIPLHPLVDSALRRWGIPRSGPVFPNPTTGRPLAASYVSRVGSVFFGDLGIDATMHQLRHWFGTHIQQISKDIRVTQELMGHASPNSSAIYTWFDQSDGRAAVAQLQLPGAADAA